MIKSGLLPIRKDARDFDHLKSFGTVIPTTGLPSEYNCDAGLWTPDQNISQTIGLSIIPALPEGCTDYTQTDLCIDEDGVLHDPDLIENVTHANANGGGDIRVALAAAITIFKRGAYFSIQASGAIDSFDALRLAMYSTENEKRSVSVGTPWYAEFENTVIQNPDGTYTTTALPANWNGILPIPFNLNRYVSWHNWKICGWKTIGDQVYLIGKSWQGPNYGVNGFHYVSRPLINQLLAINGTGAFTLSKIVPAQIVTVDATVVAQIVAFIRSLFGL